MDDLLVEFIAETRETLDALAGEIIAWEAQPGDRGHLDAIFRFVHTVKGSCGFLDLPRLARLSHAAEDVLAEVRSGNRHPDRALVNAVLSIVDRIGEIVEAIDAGHALDDTGEDLLIAALEDGTAEIVQQPQAAQQTGRGTSRSVRLNVDLLDRMMSGMSDMVLARNELARKLRETSIEPEIEASLERLSATVADMRESVTRTRMQKVEALFSPLPRMVRDTAAQLGKAVALTIEGSDVELDREMIEVMRDPLVHMIRNSIDHGIESPEERLKNGKRADGRLTVAARQSGNQIIIDISDDGRGIDTEKLIQKMAQGGEKTEAELRQLSDKAKLDLVFEPGLSSKDSVTTISGRGVGMDVVRSCIEQIGGRIEMDNRPGQGLRVAIHVPLTLSIIPTIVIGVGGHRFAIPRQAIEEIVAETGNAIRIDAVGDSRVVTIRGQRLPLVDLCALMSIKASTKGDPKTLVIVSIGSSGYAIAVDSVFDNEELVIKPAAPAIMACGLFAGQTLPDDGVPMLMLDCAGIANSAQVGSERAVSREDDQTDPDEVTTTSALLFEDLDGARRAAPIGAVDRVELVSADAIRMSAGRLRLAIDGRTIPISCAAPLGARATVPVLRLRDGHEEIGYAIAETIDIVELSGDLVPAKNAGPIAGVAMLDNDPVELLDLLWLFGENGADRTRRDSPPICLIAEDATGWISTFLKPIIEGAGYKVLKRLPKGAVADVVVTLDAQDEPTSTGGAKLLNLSSKRPDPGSGEDRLYRYDRAALLSALLSRVG